MIFQSVAEMHCNTDLWTNEVKDGIFWFCNSESILAPLEEMTDPRLHWREAHAGKKIYLLATVFSKSLLNVYLCSVYEAPKHSVKLSYILEQLCRLLMFI